MTRIATTGHTLLLRYAVKSAALVLALFTPSTTDAQLIAVKTIPLADADQFSFFPSLTSGMGGVTIAVTDALHDPFVNPATGARLRQPIFFSAPTLFSVSADAGRGSTYPIGALARSGATFGGASVAIQSINDAQPLGAIPSESSTESRSNRYGFLMFGRTLPAARLSFGASAFWSDLGTIDGTSRLYAESRGVTQAGRATDVRLGMLKEWNEGQSLEALVFNRRMRMTHDVTYGDQYWDPISHHIVIRDRMMHERDRNSAWGLHLTYLRPIGDSGWRAGVTVTANRIDNPSRPAYEFETIPGSRGRSSAFNIGVGVARTLGATTLAADAIYEPIWSRIWDVSDSSTGASTPVAKSVDSRLRFSNALLRTGVSRDLTLTPDSKLQLQLGVQARSIYYTLDQQDLVQGSTREGSTNWMEWTRTWGASLRRTSVEFHYRGRTTSGAGRPGINGFGGPPPPGPSFLSIGRVPVPSTIATLRDVNVVTHQLSISLLVR